jgi:hypothetical protein
MTYYELRPGAKVFSAGANDIAAWIADPRIEPMGENLWTRLSSA